VKQVCLPPPYPSPSLTLPSVPLSLSPSPSPPLSEYYITCITAAVEFIDSLQIPSEILLQDSALLNGQSDDKDGGGGAAGEQGEVQPPYNLCCDREREEQENREGAIAIQHLGEWLRDQQLMEDTMVVMMQEGWMG
jgi:hypothetical protein